MGMLAPLFLGGFLLIAIPWLVHQIRRPNYKKMRFSSLLFVPDVRKNVNERRKVQHPLLMLLRMLLLALLAFAFTRPFYESRFQPEADEMDRTEHLILIDRSYSMRAGTLFGDARAAALNVLEKVGRNDRVGLVMFDRTAAVLAPLRDPGEGEAGSMRRASLALRSLEPGWNTTDYRNALQTAEGLLGAGAQPEDATTRKVIHVISDFQHAGMPETDTGWKLRSDIELNPIAVGDTNLANASIDDVSLQAAGQGRVRIRGRVRNWNYPDGAPLPVRLFFGGREMAAESVLVKRGHSRQVVFTQETPPGEELIEGYLALGGDALSADDRIYFTWQPPVKTRVMVVDQPSRNTGRLSAEVLRIALTGNEDLPWEMESATPEELGARLTESETAPDIVLLAATNGIDAGAAAGLRAYLAEGGQAVWMLHRESTPSPVADALLAIDGWQLSGTRYPRALQSQFQTLGWINFSHEVFKPFRGARHNDFTGLHFYNFHRLTQTDTEADAGRVIAKFEDDSPAMIDFAIGQGRLMVWAFPVELDWTNLPKKAAFVPLFHETLGALTHVTTTIPTHVVGANTAHPPEGRGRTARWEAQLPGATETATIAMGATGAEAKPPLTPAEPGFIRWRPAGQTDWTTAEAVNLDPRESDPTRITAAEFEIRLSQDPAIPVIEATQTEPATQVDREETIQNEYGLLIVGAMLLFLLIETWSTIQLAAKIRRRQEAEA